MISHIASHGFQQLASSPSTHIAPGPGLSSIQGEQENETQQNPTPANNQKVNGTVTGQETQTEKKDNGARDQQNSAKAAKPANNSPVALDEAELKEVQKLKQRDIEVRTHEAAHLAAAGQYAQGGAKFTLERGPDGRSYAIGGSVSIDTSAEASPEATIRKADQIRRAALAPAEPSGQDRSVAAQATKLKLQAQAKVAEERRAPEQNEATNPSEQPESSTNTAVVPAAAVTASADPGTSESSSSTKKLESGVDTFKSAAQAVCAVCGGNHPTGPHLESNQSKANQYISVGQA